MRYFSEKGMFDNHASHIAIHASDADRELIDRALRTTCVAMERFEDWTTALAEIDAIRATGGVIRVDYWPDGDAQSAVRIGQLFDRALRLYAPNRKSLRALHCRRGEAFRSTSIRAGNKLEKAA